MVERYPRYGFPKLFQVLRRQGHPWNHKRIHRIYCLLKLNFRRKGKQRLPVRNPLPLATPEALNQSWSVNFMHDVLVCSRRFRTFNVVGDFNRKALSIEIDLNLPALRVVCVLDRIAANRGYLIMLRMDNGPEFISLALAEWAEQHAVKVEFIQPDKSTQNAFIERFNRAYRTEILDFCLFRMLHEVRKITEKLVSEYNCERPHESLNNMTPEEYRQHNNLAGISKNAWNLKGSIYKFSNAECLKLDEVFPRFISQMESMLTTGEMNPRHAHCVTLYYNGFTCEADTLGSCGYVYIAVYLTQR